MDRYKIMSGLMALVAVFLVFFGAKYLNSNFEVGTKNDQGSISFKVDNDWDNDDLFNSDESFWGTDPNNPDTDGDGYLDGQEVAASHDPTIPAPNDLIENDNVTNKFSGLALAGLYEGSLDPANPNYNESFSMLISSVVDDAVNKLNGVIKTRPEPISSTKQNQREYIKKISPVIEELFSTYVSELKNLSEIHNNSNENEVESLVIAFFKNQSGKYSKLFGNAINIAPPKNWESNHVGLLKLSKDLYEVHVAISRNDRDPITALAAMNRLSGLLNIVPEIVTAYADKIKIENIDTQSTIFSK